MEDKFRFIILRDFVNKKPLVLAIDSIEAIYEDHKNSISMNLEEEESKKLFDSLPEFFTKIEIKNKEIFYPVDNSIEDIVTFLATKQIEEI